MELRRLHSVEHDSVSYRGYSLDGSLPVGALPRLCRACRHRAQMEMDSLAHHSRVCPCIGRLFHQICPVVLGWLTASRWTTFAGASPRLSKTPRARTATPGRTGSPWTREELAR